MAHPTGNPVWRRPPGTRGLALLVATLLALGSTASAARADERHDQPLIAPSPTTVSGEGHDHGTATPAIARHMAGGNVRRYTDGQQATYRMRVTQTLQPKGPYAAEPQTSSLDLVLTETVTTDRRGPLVTLAVSEATAEGFLAETEQRSALGRRVSFRPDSQVAHVVLKEGRNGEPDLLDLETIKAFGDLGEIRMADLALRAHLLNPVVPSEAYAAGQSFQDTAALPAGWTQGAQTISGSITVNGQEERDGRTVIRLSATHVSTDTLLRVRAINNAVEALQGNEPPDPNEFFAGTLFNALFPPGSTYESLMPPLPLQIDIQGRRAGGNRGNRKAGRPRRRLGLVLVCLLAFGMAACTDPQRNVHAVSLNLTGPLQMNHQSVVDRQTGVLLSSEVTATARMSGKVYPIPDELKAVLAPELSGLSMAEVGMDADWTISQELVGDIPEPGRTGPMGGRGTPAVLGGGVALGLAAFMLVRRRSKQASGASPAVL